jgi:serine phosphatase RsbU (regulator of sigma subunit)/DNA-binding NarL/FixJ family response regulator
MPSDASARGALGSGVEAPSSRPPGPASARPTHGARGGEAAARATIRVLYVEDDPADAEIGLSRLSESRRTEFEVAHVTRLAPALERLEAGGVDVVLLDLDLPDSKGLSTFLRVAEAHPDVPIVVLTGFDDDATGLRAVQRGAQDFLSKDRVSTGSLTRAVRYAVERHAMLLRLELAAREARQNARHLRSLVGKSAEGFVVLDADRRVRFANPAAARLLGRDPDALVGWALDLPVLSGEAREVRVPRPDGTTVPAEMRVAPLEWEGGLASLVSLHDLEDRRRADRMALAQTVQRAFLPERTRLSAPPFDLSGSNELFEDASGDYYDFVPLSHDRVGVAVGDVAGHGLGPAMLMAQARAFLRAFWRTTDDLPTVMGRVNDALVADMSQGRFMTLFLAVFDPGSPVVHWCNAGHVPALLARDGSGEVVRLEATGPVLGVREGMPFLAGEAFESAPGDVLFVCSDGATDAVRPDGERFGLDRVASVLRDRPAPTADAALDAVRSALREWTCARPLHDDLTLAAVRRDDR